MAKNNLTPEVLQMILTKVTDKLTEAFKLLIEQVVSALNTRIDNIEQKLSELHTSSSNTGTAETTTASISSISANAGSPSLCEH